MGNEGTSTHIRNLGTRRMSLVSFTFAAASLLTERPLVPTVREGGLTNRPEGNGRDKNFLRLSGPKRDEVTGEWRKLHNEELKGLYSSPNIVRVIKSRRLRWGGHVARMGEGRGVTGCWWGNPRGRDRWGDLGVDGRIILGWTFRRWDVGMWTVLG